MNKRHAKPTTAQLISRIYRQQLAHHKNIEYQLAVLISNREEIRSALAMLSERLETIREGNLATVKTLADHCLRLLREKETLMKAAQGLHDSHAFMSYPLKEEPRDFETETMTVKIHEYPRLKGCGFKLLHRAGVRCAVCGELEIDQQSYMD